ncbi:hypothetical protein RJ639_016325 [Escallonia herrerae]|uniref:DUF4219 domain-containing protein n=1 Tax=Escallonia herrerae TaxID=1293975 RepID=A0AA89ANH6_9ASTE|nr:hypothetical protein RJ639_016325 [Escallonia herrerae]
MQKLNYSDYQPWRICMEAYFQEQDLWVTVDGEATEVIANAPRKAKVNECGKTFFSLRSSVHKDLIERIRDKESPRMSGIRWKSVLPRRTPHVPDPDNWWIDLSLIEHVLKKFQLLLAKDNIFRYWFLLSYGNITTDDDNDHTKVLPDGTSTRAQASSGNAVSRSIAGPHVVPTRSVARPMHMGGMQRMQPQGMTAYNLASQAGMGAGMNPASKRPRNRDDWIPPTIEIKALLRPNDKNDMPRKVEKEASQSPCHLPALLVLWLSRGAHIVTAPQLMPVLAEAEVYCPLESTIMGTTV